MRAHLGADRARRAASPRPSGRQVTGIGSVTPPTKRPSGPWLRKAMKYAAAEVVDHLADVPPLVGDADRGGDVDRSARAVDRDRPHSSRAGRGAGHLGRQAGEQQHPAPLHLHHLDRLEPRRRSPSASLSGGPTSQSRRSTEIAWPTTPDPVSAVAGGDVHVPEPALVPDHPRVPPRLASLERQPGPGPALQVGSASSPTRSAAPVPSSELVRPVVNSHQASRPCTTQPVHCARSSNAAGCGSGSSRRVPVDEVVGDGVPDPCVAVPQVRVAERVGGVQEEQVVPTAPVVVRRPEVPDVGVRELEDHGQRPRPAALALAGHRPALHGDPGHQRQPGDPHDRRLRAQLRLDLVPGLDEGAHHPDPVDDDPRAGVDIDVDPRPERRRPGSGSPGR